MLAGGFADPVFDSQRAFRALLDALARPGQPVALPSDLDPPAPLTPELATVALSLADPDASVWLDEKLSSDPAVAAFLRFHTGAPIVAEPQAASFALVTDAARMPSLGSFGIGTDEYPDRSTTVVIALPTLAGGPALVLTGPGIAEATAASPPLPPGFVAAWRRNGALFPRGVDILLAAPGQVLGVPRSTRIAEAA